jgi:hypothetical protein
MNSTRQPKHPWCQFTVDLQLGGKDTMSNMSGLDKSVNTSLGSQINSQTKNLPAGTPVNKVKMTDK